VTYLPPMRGGGGRRETNRGGRRGVAEPSFSLEIPTYEGRSQVSRLIIALRGGKCDS